MEYLLHILILIGIYAILGVSLNLVAGYTGLLSVAHAAFFGVGAYSAALGLVRLGVPFIVGVALASVMAAMLGIVVALPSLRIHDDYFVIATFALQVLMFSLFNNSVTLTGGPIGISGIPQPVILGLPVASHLRFLMLVVAALAMTVVLVYRLTTSAYGRVLRAIREDEVFTQSLGKNVTGYKIVVFVVSGAMASWAGALYATFITFIDPTSFTLTESMFILAIVIIGGAGNVIGPVIGAGLLIAIPEALRFVGLPAGVAANLRQMLYGLLIVLFMLLRPQGIVGEHAFIKRGR